MALCGPWGVFYHIPKTGGSWVRLCLRDNMGQGHESGRPHGWAHPFEPDHPAQPYLMKGPYFTFVRHPATWLRSFWNHTGVAKWIGRDKQDSHWGTLCWLTKECASDDWDEFAWNVVEKLPGLADWFMHSYAQPNVVVGCMEDYPYSLKKVLPDLMCTKPPRNQATNPLPEISDVLSLALEASNPWLSAIYADRGHIEPLDKDYEYNFDIPDRGPTVKAFIMGE